MDRYIAEGRVAFRETSGTPYLKRYLSEVRQGLTLPTILTEFGFSSTSASELDKLFIKKGLFEYAKPTTLIKIFIDIGVPTKNDLILDFFAGSGTTAHAVMDLNAEDGGDRKFILVQIAEPTDKKSEAYKAGYQTIFDITKARIEKAGQKIKSESSLLNQNMDLGFKIYKTVPIFENYLEDIEELSQDTQLFNPHNMGQEQIEILLTTWKLYDGMRLNQDLEVMDFNGYRGYYGNGSIYFMDSGFNGDVLDAFIAKLDNQKSFEPSKLILFGYNFDSRYQREIKEALAIYTNKKSIELDVIIRY